MKNSFVSCDQLISKSREWILKRLAQSRSVTIYCYEYLGQVKLVMEKPCSDVAAFLSEDGQTGFDLGEDSLDVATRRNVKIAAHSSSYKSYVSID